jgi:hypothetical protein
VALTNRSSKTKTKIMKTLIKFVLAAAIMVAGFAAQADWVSGHFRDHGTYCMSRRIVAPIMVHQAAPPVATVRVASTAIRNPYAAYPSVSVRGYFRGNDPFVWPHVRTTPHWTVTDNLSYRGFGTIVCHDIRWVVREPEPRRTSF